MKFQLLSGFHVQGHPTKEDPTTCRKDADGLPAAGTGIKIDVRFGPGHDNPDKEPVLIETDKDLCKMFNSPGIPPKFRQHGKFIPDGYSLSEEVHDGLETMTVADLKDLAEMEEVNLKNATKKDAILTILRAYGIKAPENAGV